MANRRLALRARRLPQRRDRGRGDPRPPGTQNFKHDPPAAVVAERLRPWRRFNARRLVDELPDAAAGAPAERRTSPGPRYATTIRCAGSRRRSTCTALTGRTVGRDGKAACPFHPDDTPSLHAYQEPERGWYCFGCGRGGSIFDLAAEVYGLSTRGRDFVELRRRLVARAGRLGAREHRARGGTADAATPTPTRRRLRSLWWRSSGGRRRTDSPDCGTAKRCGTGLVSAHHPHQEGTDEPGQHQPRDPDRQPDRRSGAALAAQRHVGLQAARRVATPAARTARPASTSTSPTTST